MIHLGGNASRCIIHAPGHMQPFLSGSELLQKAQEKQHGEGRTEFGNKILADV